MRNLALLLLLLFGSADAADDSLLTLDRIFESDEFASEEAPAPRWLRDGAGWVELEENNILLRDPESGEAKLLVPSERLVTPGSKTQLKVERFSWSSDRRRFLLAAEGGDETWALDTSTWTLRQLGPDLGPLSDEQLSPDGRLAAYVAERDLYVEDFLSGKIKRLTKGGSETIVNATSEGVYTGLNTAGFRWSPDSQRIAYVQFDIEGVKSFTFINYTASLYSETRSFPHVKPGETLPAARAGVVNVSGGKTTWLEILGDRRGHYLREIEWAANASDLVVQQLNRKQNSVKVFLANAKSGKVRSVWQEEDSAWVEPQAIRWLEGGRQFLWTSERDGWRRLYLQSRDGGSPKAMTPAEMDLLSLEGVDEDQGWIYFIASPDNPTQRYLYRVSLDGSAKAERVSPANLPGTHSYNISPDASWALHTYSTIESPPVTSVITLPEHRRARVVTDNSALRSAVAELSIRPPEFLKVDIGDGVELDASMILPPDFEPSRRYPVLFYVYGMPAGQTVLDQWGDKRYLWHQMLAQRGYIVMSVDNRGTPAPKGRAWRKIIYLRHGVLPAHDQAAALRSLLRERPYLDPSKVGVYGWSGGGLMSTQLILRYPKLYSTAMAGAGITHHRLYHAGFTERFLGLPQDNPDAYEETATVNLAGNLEGNLLLIHGTGDSNVHFQTTETLINALIEKKKRFTMMAYPNRNHGIVGTTQRHLYDLYTWYLQENMPVGHSPSRD